MQCNNSSNNNTNNNSNQPPNSKCMLRNPSTRLRHNLLASRPYQVHRQPLSSSTHPRCHLLLHKVVSMHHSIRSIILTDHNSRQRRLIASPVTTERRPQPVVPSMHTPCKHHPTWAQLPRRKCTRTSLHNSAWVVDHHRLAILIRSN